MKTETKAYIEQNISLIKNNEITSVYLNCPLHILNDFNNTMHVAGIEYPLMIHNYVVISCYMSITFRGVVFQLYDFENSTKTEVYEFVCDNCLYLVEQIYRDLAVLLPKKSVHVSIAQQQGFRNITRLNIRVEVH